MKLKNIETDAKLIYELNKLPDDYWDFKTSDTREFTHGLHSYPAIMVCPISRNIINIMKSITEFNSLFDPFSGSGTVLVEGILAGIKNISGNDINPLANFLSNVKTTLIEKDILEIEYQKLILNINNRYSSIFDKLLIIDNYFFNDKNLDVTSKDTWGMNATSYLKEFCADYNLEINIPDFINIGYWFKPKIIIELELIKEEILNTENKDIQNFFFVAFSECIRLVSNKRNGEFKMFRMPYEKVLNHNPNVFEEFNKILKRNIKKMNAFYEICREKKLYSNIKIYDNDTCLLDDVSNNFYDIVITSPPYGDSRTTVAYGEFSRLSLQWLDLFELSDKEIMNIDKSLMGGQKYRKGYDFTLNSPTLKESLDRIKEKDIERAGDVYSFYSDLDKSLAAISNKTKSGGYQFWVVGNRTVKEELLMTDRIIYELSEKYNMKYIHTINRNISNKVMPSLNSPTNEIGKKSSTMTNEHIVILRKI